MIATIIIGIFAGTAIGISFFCLRKIKEIANIRDIYEGYIIDMIEELQRYRDEDSND